MTPAATSMPLDPGRLFLVAGRSMDPVPVTVALGDVTPLLDPNRWTIDVTKHGVRKPTSPAADRATPTSVKREA